MRKYWQVILKDGQRINVPSGKPQNEYEFISKYGVGAIIERVSRTSAAKKLVADGIVESSKYVVHTIIAPDGEEITQF